MGVIRFPYEAENNHPQYLWNVQEYIIRMLMQQSIGVSLEEASTAATITHDPSISHNFTANGPADFPNNNISAQFSTNGTGWVYLRADGGAFYLSEQMPSYNQYLHGWYHPTQADRAVVFIDSEQPAGYRCFVMDTYNSMFQYNARIADTGGATVFSKGYGSPDNTDGGDWEFTLQPGRYRFELRGGRGGNGGNSAAPSVDGQLYGYGGEGAVPPAVIFKLTILSTVTLTGYVGFNGSHGADGNRITTNPVTAEMSGTGGGGGSSGEDTYIQSASITLTEAIGGAGGGGGNSDNHSGGTLMGKFITSGAGGGGAGAGTAGNGTIGYNPYGYGYNTPARAGTMDNGGAGQPDGRLPGDKGQNRGSLRRRDGGNSPGDAFIADSAGGASILSSTHGYARIIRTGDVAS
jgi:hypothetical protein